MRLKPKDGWDMFFIKCLIVTVGVVIFSGVMWLSFWTWRVNHPGSPWWGFLLHG